MKKLADAVVSVGLTVLIIGLLTGLCAKTWSDVFWARTAQTQMARQNALLERIAAALEQRR